VLRRERQVAGLRDGERGGDGLEVPHLADQDHVRVFAQALKYALRQDPDVILVGEMRDLETIQAALTIAETGHLCLATLHTNSAAESINRIIDVFPSNQQSQVRAQLAFVLEGVVTQTLLPKAKGRGRVMACEIMVATPAIRALIRDDKIHQIYSAMQSGKKHGMQTMNDALFQLYTNREVAQEECERVSSEPKEFLRMIGVTPMEDQDIAPIDRARANSGRR
jgi:twitching motility protein PilT